MTKIGSLVVAGSSFHLPPCSDQLWGPNIDSSHKYRGAFPSEQWPDRVNLTTTHAKVKNVCTSTSNPYSNIHSVQLDSFPSTVRMLLA